MRSLCVCACVLLLAVSAMPCSICVYWVGVWKRCGPVPSRLCRPSLPVFASLLPLSPSNINSDMAEYEGRTKVVFVGNLPYDATEQEVQKVFEVAGPVVSFRHVFDRDSNKAKGFGGGQANEHDLDAPQALR